jgi:hypothetical protein
MSRNPPLPAREERRIRHFHAETSAELDRLGAGLEERRHLAEMVAALRHRAWARVLARLENAPDMGH